MKFITGYVSTRLIYTQLRRAAAGDPKSDCETKVPLLLSRTTFSTSVFPTLTVCGACIATILCIRRTLTMCVNPSAGLYASRRR